MNEKTLKDLIASLKTAGKPKTSAYDTTATVTRVEGGTAWVHIPGGVTETPVKLTISAKAGDNVQVRVSGGRAFMVGNASAPPTDDTVATGAVRQISTVRKVVERVREVAETASRIAGNTNQYFWHTQEGTDTGAHITEIPQDEFLADPTKGGGNTLIRSNGVAVRDGLTELSTFSANGCYLGNETTSRLILNNVGITGMTDTGVETFKVVTGDYSGTQTITETTGIIENTASDKTTMRAFFNANHSPSFATDVVFNLSIVVEYSGQTKSSDTQVDYRYDPNNIYIQSFGADKVMMFQSGYVTVHIDGSYQTNRVGISFDITVNNLQAKIQNAQVSVTMPIPDPVLPSYTFGTRVERPDQYGSYSFIAGSRNKATDDYSVALGVDNVASGLASLAVNDDNKATGLNSFASGNGSIASGARASTFGGDTLASSNDQMVIGRRNVEDANDTYAFIIGNGDYAEETRSNAFTVDWSGNVGYFGNAIPDQTNTRYLGNSTHRWQNLYSHYVNASATITAGAVASYTPTWATGHTAADYHCVVSAGICSFSYRGPTIAHSAGTQIGTLPVGARPKSVVYCPCVKMSGGAVGCMRIFTTGVVEVMMINDTASTGRLYFNCTFPVV